MERCECKKFEFLRISCMHLLAYFRHLVLQRVPPEYILRRWRVDSKKYSSFNDEIDRISKGKESLTNQILMLILICFCGHSGELVIV